MSKKTCVTVSDYFSTEVEADVEFHLEHVLEFIDIANNDELVEISKALDGRSINSNYIKKSTLNDELKSQLLAKAVEKYSLEELEKRLRLDWL
mgnify:CR=1 FL=1